MDWMMENVKTPTREEAVALGQMLMYRGIIRHVTNTQPFVDGNSFYRFSMDDHDPNAEVKERRKKHNQPGTPGTPENQKPSRVFTPQEVKTIAEAMQHPTNGVELKDRRDFLHSYKDTFLGCEAKLWMEKHLGKHDKPHAEEILQTLKDRGVFYSCNKKIGPFRPDKEIYAFYSVFIPFSPLFNIYPFPPFPLSFPFLYSSPFPSPLLPPSLFTFSFPFPLFSSSFLLYLPLPIRFLFLFIFINYFLYFF